MLGDGPDLREGRGVRRVWMGVLLRHDLQLHIVELVVAELERNEERKDVVGRCLKGTFRECGPRTELAHFRGHGGNDQLIKACEWGGESASCGGGP